MAPPPASKTSEKYKPPTSAPIPNTRTASSTGVLTNFTNANNRNITQFVAGSRPLGAPVSTQRPPGLMGPPPALPAGQTKSDMQLRFEEICFKSPVPRSITQLYNNLHQPQPGSLNSLPKPSLPPPIPQRSHTSSIGPKNSLIATQPTHYIAQRTTTGNPPSERQQPVQYWGTAGSRKQLPGSNAVITTTDASAENVRMKSAGGFELVGSGSGGSGLAGKGRSHTYHPTGTFGINAHKGLVPNGSRVDWNGVKARQEEAAGKVLDSSEPTASGSMNKAAITTRSSVAKERASSLPAPPDSTATPQSAEKPTIPPRELVSPAKEKRKTRGYKEKVKEQEAVGFGWSGTKRRRLSRTLKATVSTPEAITAANTTSTEQRKEVVGAVISMGKNEEILLPYEKENGSDNRSNEGVDRHIKDEDTAISRKKGKFSRKERNKSPGDEKKEEREKEKEQDTATEKRKQNSIRRMSIPASEPEETEEAEAEPEIEIDKEKQNEGQQEEAEEEERADDEEDGEEEKEEEEEEVNVKRRQPPPKSLKRTRQSSIALPTSEPTSTPIPLPARRTRQSIIKDSHAETPKRTSDPKTTNDPPLPQWAQTLAEEKAASRTRTPKTKTPKTRHAPLNAQSASAVRRSTRASAALTAVSTPSRPIPKASTKSAPTAKTALESESEARGRRSSRRTTITPREWWVVGASAPVIIVPVPKEEPRKARNSLGGEDGLKQHSIPPSAEAKKRKQTWREVEEEVLEIAGMHGANVESSTGANGPRGNGSDAEVIDEDMDLQLRMHEEKRSLSRSLSRGRTSVRGTRRKGNESPSSRRKTPEPRPVSESPAPPPPHPPSSQEGPPRKRPKRKSAPTRLVDEGGEGEGVTEAAGAGKGDGDGDVDGDIDESQLQIERELQLQKGGAGGGAGAGGGGGGGGGGGRREKKVVDVYELASPPPPPTPLRTTRGRPNGAVNHIPTPTSVEGKLPPPPSPRKTRGGGRGSGGGAGLSGSGSGSGSGKKVNGNGTGIRARARGGGGGKGSGRGRGKTQYEAEHEEFEFSEIE